MPLSNQDGTRDLLDLFASFSFCKGNAYPNVLLLEPVSHVQGLSLSRLLSALVFHLEVGLLVQETVRAAAIFLHLVTHSI